MDILYKDIKTLDPADLRELFLSVEWSSGQYPEKLAVAMQNSETVFTAWDGGRLIGLVNALDDGAMTAYVHYLLVRPEYQGKGVGRALLRHVTEKYGEYLRIVLVSCDGEVDFYKRCGFAPGEGKTPMFITSLRT